MLLKEKFLEWLNQVGKGENMSFIDPVGDMLTRIRNGQMRNLHQVQIPASNFRGKIGKTTRRSNSTRRSNCKQ